MVYQPLYVKNVETSWTHAIVFGRMHNEHKENCKIFYNLQTNSREVRRYVLCSYEDFLLPSTLIKYALVVWIDHRRMQDVYIFCRCNSIRKSLTLCILVDAVNCSGWIASNLMQKLSFNYHVFGKQQFTPWFQYIFENQSFTLL